MPQTDSAARLASLDAEPALVRAIPITRVPSFAEIYRTYFTFVWSSSRRLGVNESEIDDVVQEIFITINGRLSTLEQPDSLRSWIYSIVRRTVSSYHRAKRAKNASTATLSAEPEMHYSQTPSPQQLAEHSDQVKLLWTLLENIDATKREVFVLAELDEMTVPEIASALEVPLNTVYSRLRAARLELEAALQRQNAQTINRGRSCPT